MRAIAGPARRRRQLNVMGAKLSANVVFAVCVGLYLTAATFVFAGNNAQYQWKCHHQWATICDEDMVAQDRGMAAMTALLPPLWVVSFFYTGGFHRGFSFDASPHVPSRN
jgi:uncharacterized lipoprotein YmbA